MIKRAIALMTFLMAFVTSCLNPEPTGKESDKDPKIRPNIIKIYEGYDHK